MLISVAIMSLHTFQFPLANESAERLAKVALLLSLPPLSLLCCLDLKLKVNMYIDLIWQELWNNETRNTLHKILSNINVITQRIGLSEI